MSSEGQTARTTIPIEQDVFQKQWQIYRKMVDENFPFHREAYVSLGHLLRSRAPRRFRFLDIACGDGSATIAALEGTKVTAYYGIDLSQAALDLAASTLSRLNCPVHLSLGDFAQILVDWTQPVDVAWIGLSLHHFAAAKKLPVMREAQRILMGRGMLLVYENTSREGESRSEWLSRFERQRADWTAYTEDEWQTMWDHVRLADFPETRSTWRELGRQAGFRSVEEIYTAPTDLFSLFCFS